MQEGDEKNHYIVIAGLTRNLRTSCLEPCKMSKITMMYSLREIVERIASISIDMQVLTDFARRAFMSIEDDIPPNGLCP
ncbi:hypothetical protein FACS1894199_14160 [Bacteroidia bacterium]|nr:hypothetical protein FACS1894199_14160 [Bacteroidia bacterium]